MSTMHEVNFDGLVSPTHNFSGLAIGNLASTRSSGRISRPREAALQGLDKMWALARRGVPQAFLPPQLRPSLPTLKRLGFLGDEAEILQQAFEQAPDWFAACSSASAMWTANAATIAPSIDTADGRVHLTPANLVTNFHRSIEVTETASTLKSIFSSEAHFVHHPPLPATPMFADEGAANHIRLTCGDSSALHVFVYGTTAADRANGPKRFPARQSLEGCQAVARLHQLPESRVLFLRQNPDAIDAGAFHNDVVSVGHENVFLYHEETFANPEESLESIRSKFDGPLHSIPVTSRELTLKQAVDSYLFNSQIVTLPNGRMLMVCPLECLENPSVQELIKTKIVTTDSPISEVLYLDLRQSMNNGGGPACLRLRVLLTSAELDSLPERIFLTENSSAFLRHWIEQHYPEELTLADLACAHRYFANSRALANLKRWIGI